jgi:hypothetical protein
MTAKRELSIFSFVREDIAMPDFIGRLQFATDKAAALLELQRDFRAELQAPIKSRVRGRRSRRAT